MLRDFVRRLGRPTTAEQTMKLALGFAVLLIPLTLLVRWSSARGEEIGAERLVDVMTILLWLLLVCVVALMLCGLALGVGERMGIEPQIVGHTRLGRKMLARSYRQLVTSVGVPWPKHGEVLQTERLDLVGVGTGSGREFVALHDEDFRHDHGWTTELLAGHSDAVLEYEQSLYNMPGTWLLRLRSATDGVAAGTAIGFVTLSTVERSGEERPGMDGERPNIGLQITAGHRGKGYTSEALRAVLARVLEDDCGPVQMVTDAENLAVVRLAEKLNFTEIDRQPHELPDGQNRSAIIYEWPAF